ncbi:hypothetical protein [Porcipelethomonas sp.]|uniref:hypothetical protein n=1 Tax=Porcipelethomonas sp. TaxID=2981675 RepID=UPI003EF377A4
MRLNKKLLKFIAALQASTLLLSALSCNISANEYDINSIEGLETINVDDIPSDVTPIEFETEEEFVEFYNNYLSNDINITDSGSCALSNSIMPFSYSGNYSSSYTTQKELIKIGASITSIKLKTNFTYEKETTTGPLPANKPRYKFKTVNPTCMLTGLTVGVSISQVSTSYSLSNYNSTCTSNGTGTIDYYIIVENIGKVYSKPFSITHTFNLVNVV